MSASTRRSFLVTADGDLDTSTGTLVFASGLTAMKQAVRASILLFLGEWFLNTAEGTPWFQKVLVKNPNAAVLKRVFRDRILNVKGVKTVDELSLAYDASKRSLSITFAATCDFGVFDDTINLG